MQTSLVVAPWLPMARRTEPDDPGGGGHGWEEAAAEHFLWEAGLLSSDDIPINHTTALTYSAVFACVRIISQTIAGMGWHVFERLGEGKGKRRIDMLEDPVAWLLRFRPSRELNAFEWRQVMLKDALTWGNGVSEIERDGAGRPMHLWRIAPERVTLTRNNGGELIYVVDEDSDDEVVLLPENVFHLRGLSPDGLIGYSVIDMARRYIELGLDIGSFGTAFFKRGPLPGGVLEMPGRVTQAEKAETRKSFEKVYGGTKNAGRVIVLSGGAKFTGMSLPNTDAQFIESHQLTVQDICRFYGVPPHKVADLERSTNNNIEHQSIEFVEDCILPWCQRLESEADIKLFGRTNQGRRYTQINIESKLRGDSRTQTETVTAKVNNALMTVNEGRDYFGLNPIDGGDTPLVQGAMIPLERALEEPEPMPAPAAPQPDGDPGDETDEVPEEVAAAFTPILADAYGRLLRVKADKSKRGKLDIAEHREHAMQAVLPILRALAVAGRYPVDRVGVAAGTLVDRYCANGHGKDGPAVLVELREAWKRMK